MRPTGRDVEEAAAAAAASPNRRGRARVREVSSRFMSPSNSNSVQIPDRPQRRQFQEVNRKWEEMGRSLDSPLPKPSSVYKENDAGRPDTPMVRPDPTHGNRTVSSRYRQTPCHRPGPGASTPAAKLLQDATRSSADHCSRSLTFTSLPPLPLPLPHPKLGKHQNGEDAHSLKLLTNRYLQWRFMNAKAEASMLSNKMDIEGQLCSAAIKLSDMRDSVKRRRCQLQMLRTIQTSSAVAQLQMPYLEEWCGVEEDYSASLCAATDAFKCLSLRLPVSEGVKMGVTELGEVLDSAQKLIEMIISHTRGYMVNAEQVEGLASELARVMGREGAHIHDSGSSLLKVHTQQVEECCLRGHLIRLHSDGRTQHRQNQSSQT